VISIANSATHHHRSIRLAIAWQPLIESDTNPVEKTFVGQQP